MFQRLGFHHLCQTPSAGTALEGDIGCVEGTEGTCAMMGGRPKLDPALHHFIRIKKLSVKQGTGHFVLTSLQGEDGF